MSSADAKSGGRHPERGQFSREQDGQVVPSSRPVTVSVIIPARNEESSLGACLESLVAQTGVAFEIIVVDDHSDDHTRAIATSFHGVRLIEAGPLPDGWTGKNNAVITGASVARGEWLLFTDADTVHLPGSLARALAEAKDHGADMLSYSPEQIAASFWEMATLPVVFAELARQYSPSKVSDPNSPIAAANGQYILVKRDAYNAVGGHTSIASEILEDVALARAIKSSGRKLFFRYAADAVHTRMYRNFAQLQEGWTKNLALLFPSPGWLAAKMLALWAIPWIVLALILAGAVKPWWSWVIVFVAVLLSLTLRLRRANFGRGAELFGAIFGMPMFAHLLLRSKTMHAYGNVPWKGRAYPGHPRQVSQLQERDGRVQRMKMSVIPAVPTMLLAGCLALKLDAFPSAFAAQNSEKDVNFLQTLIEPGAAVGPLKLGDSEERALELFPKKAEDQRWQDHCGTTLDWVDAANPMGRGDLLIRLKKGKAFQIESATTRFHTAEGITTFDRPEKVANAYKDLRAFVLLTAPVPALGDRPLVFWIDKKKGIAFALAYDPSKHKRYVYKIIVFESNKTFCPELETTESPKWQQISPYAVEPPAELSPERAY